MAATLASTVISLAAEPDPSWQVNTSFSGRRYSLDYTAPTPSSTSGTGEAVGLEVTRFFAPLHDDGAPYSLEPFLQRASSWSLSIDGSHLTTNHPFGGPSSTDWSGGISTSVDVYVKRWLILNGGVSTSYDRQTETTEQSSHSVSGYLDLGLRVADTRVDGWYTVNAEDVGGASSRFRNRFGASMFTAIARRFSLSLDGNRIPGGGNGEIALEYFARQDLGIFGGLFAEKGTFYSTNLEVQEYSGWLGVATWLDPTVGVEGSYTLTTYDAPVQLIDQTPFGYHDISHQLLFEVLARFDRL
ncbi:MAG TPA: hypothetical protein VHJ20_14845 [Polyangia bacterium]|nr:hypothetical protein [Polyangia bacterium]